MALPELLNLIALPSIKFMFPTGQIFPKFLKLLKVNPNGLTSKYSLLTSSSYPNLINVFGK